VGLSDEAEGILESVDKAGISFSSEKLGPTALRFDFDKLRAIRLAELEEEKTAPALEGLTVTVELAGGSRLTGRLGELEVVRREHHRFRD